MESVLVDYARLVGGAASSLAQVGALVLCLALWVNRRNPRAILDAVSAGSVRFNLAVAAIDMLVFYVPIALLAGVMGGFLRRHGLVLFDMPTETGDVAFAVIAALAVLIGDFVGYWRHRLEHYGWFWRAHVMHHSDATMNWTTVYRIHPFNRLTTTLIDAGVLVLIGFPAWVILINNLIRHYYGIFTHINQPWTLGWAGKVLVSPAMHRWHHVLEGQGVGKNFASVFSIFDRMFGTYHCPGPCGVALGVEGFGESDLIRQYLLPVRDLGR